MKQQRTQKALKALSAFDPQEIKGTQKVNAGITIEIHINHKGAIVRYWPYSGVFEGESVRNGRGLKQLLQQVKA